MNDQKLLESRRFVLTLTGPQATRSMLHAVETHFKHGSAGAVYERKTDFGGLFNPLAEVQLTSTRDAVDQSVSWMKGFASRRRLILNVVIEDRGSPLVESALE